MSYERPDYYVVLGVPKTATDAELRRAYKAQALRYHPDKNPGDAEEATKQFKLIAEAYSVLKDPGARSDYDRSSSFDPSGTAFSFDKAADLFKDVFGFELVGTLSTAARGIVRAPGTVLAAAADRCPEIPGIRRAVAAGCESMVADAELDLASQTQQLADLDVRVDDAVCEAQSHDTSCIKAESERLCDRTVGWNHLRQIAVRLGLTFAACCLALHLEAALILGILVFPCILFFYRTVKSCIDLVHLFERHTEHTAAERLMKAHLQEALRVAREALEAQRGRAAAARQELARLRNHKVGVEQSGPSFGDALGVGAHLVGRVVSGASRAVFRTNSRNAVCD